MSQLQTKPLFWNLTRQTGFCILTESSQVTFRFLPPSYTNQKLWSLKSRRGSTNHSGEFINSLPARLVNAQRLLTARERRQSPETVETCSWRMRIYFCGSIRGGRDDVNIYRRLVETLRSYGTVLTEHVSSSGLSDKGQSSNSLHVQ